MIDIVLDLEATCWADGNKGHQMEIIEIGAVKIKNQEIIDEYDCFIRPVINPILSDFCTELTTIKQEDVKDAKTFPYVLRDFLEWCENDLEEDYSIWTWGKFDRTQFEKDCAFHKVDDTWLIDRHFNLSEAFRVLNRAKKMGIVQASKRVDITLEGTLHRGIDDAKNIAKIFLNDFEWYVANTTPTVKDPIPIEYIF